MMDLRELQAAAEKLQLKGKPEHMVLHSSPVPTDTTRPCWTPSDNMQGKEQEPLPQQM